MLRKLYEFNLFIFYVITLGLLKKCTSLNKHIQIKMKHH